MDGVRAVAGAAGFHWGLRWSNERKRAIQV